MLNVPVLCNYHVCGSNGWFIKDQRMLHRLSRWLKVKTNYRPGKNNSLWDYVTDTSGYHPNEKQFNLNDELELKYFTFNGRNYAIDQFMCLFNPFWCCFGYSYDDNGKTRYLSGYDSENYYNPILIELDEYGEYVRVYMEEK